LLGVRASSKLTIAKPDEIGETLIVWVINLNHLGGHNPQA
jgi:hypothetical protein